ncbi:Conserved oligomeric Golgi complex subunit 1 [Abortiporus biennis]
MARRPSAASLSSLNSGIIPKLAQLPSLSESTMLSPSHNGSASAGWTPSRTVSLQGKLGGVIESNGGFNELDPDEMFAKHTIAAVRAIQARLRNDADAKQQELRLMVGERYRDLLQASTSIISIAQSSTNVLHAFEEMRDLSSSADTPRSARGVSSVGQEDAHLQALQSLSAHMKLLLDAPEHLWRLIERRSYLHAAWLFLLSRVVHRALSRTDEEEEVGWHVYDIDVTEQFPLVQRQWDTVSQFRSQITHKAGLSLREHTSTPTEVCATLLTLHLLESRPLLETLNVLLSQRSKTLSAKLCTSQHKVPNGYATESTLPSRSRKPLVREVRQRLVTTLELIASTIGTAREVFMDDESRSSLMSGILQFIQAESPPSTDTLPAELKLTTQSLLTSLPSSSHFMLLPLNIRSFRPYIDIKSSIPREYLNDKLARWFRKASDDLQEALGKWFLDLQSVREVWEVRSEVQQWIRIANGLDEHEKSQMTNVLNAASEKQICAIWDNAIKVTTKEFSEQLDTALSALKEKSESSLFDAQPVQFLFQPPPAFPTHTFHTTSTNTSFQKYKNTLRHQLQGRTPLLNSLLENLEHRAREMHVDLQSIKSSDEDSQSLADGLIETYRSESDRLCNNIDQLLDSRLNKEADDTDLAIGCVLFIGRIASELSFGSYFVHIVGCDTNSLEAFRSKMRSLNQHAVQQWQHHAVSDAMRSYWPAGKSISPPVRLPEKGVQKPHPSSNLVNTLLALSASLQQLSLPPTEAKRREWVIPLLDDYAYRYLKHLHADVSSNEQTAWDLMFIGVLLDSWGKGKSPTRLKIDEAISRSLSEAKSDEDGMKAILECLSRTQVLLASLLPSLPSSSIPKTKTERPSSLLHFGSPSIGSQFEPVVDMVKPSPRFGLLLVGSSGA